MLEDKGISSCQVIDTQRSPLHQRLLMAKNARMTKNAHGQESPLSAAKIIVRPFFFKYFIYLSIVHISTSILPLVCSSRKQLIKRGNVCRRLLAITWMKSLIRSRRNIPMCKLY